MTMTVEAVYENGTLKLAQPLPLKEHQRVHVTIQAPSWVQETYGIAGWVGDPAELRRLALSPDFDLEDEP